MKPLLKSISVIAMLISLSSCAQLFTTTSGQLNLTQRVSGLMNAKIEGDWNTVYNYYNQNYRNHVERNNFTRGGKITFTSYKIKSININPDTQTATAEVKTSFISGGFKFNDAISHQNWIIEHGNWYQKIPLSGSKGILGK